MLQFLRSYLFLDPNIPDANRPKITGYFNQIILMGRLGAVLPIDRAGLLSKLYYFYMASTLFFVVITGFQFAFSCVLRFDGDIAKITDLLVNIPIYLFGSVLVMHYQLRNGFLKMMFRYAYENFRYRSARGLTIFTMATAVRFNKIIIPVFTLGILFSSYQWIITATISTWRGQRRLPLDIDYPVDSHATPYFELIFALHFYMQNVLAFQYVNMTCIFIVFSTLVIAQLDILRCSIKNTGYTALLRLGVPHAALNRPSGFTSNADAHVLGSEEEIDCCYDQIGNTEVRVHFKYYRQNYRVNKKHSRRSEVYFGTFQNLDKNVIEEKVLEAIADCVQHHLVIRTFCEYMEVFFKPAFGLNIFGLCTAIAFMLYASTDHFEVKMVEYLMLAILMTLIICYMGHQIRLQSERLDMAVYWSGWEEQSVRVRKHYHILMLQALRPVILTGGGMVRLNLDNFFAVMKMAFSFFTLMRNASRNKHHDYKSFL